MFSGRTGFLCVCALFGTCLTGTPTLAQPAPTEAAAAAVLVDDASTRLTDFASQRDAIGGWPAAVQNAYTNLTQLSAQLQSAQTAGDIATVRKRYQAFMRMAARISRWLVNHFAPANDEAPRRDKADTIIANLTDRVDLLTQVASQAGKTLDLTAINSARAQLQTARSTGTDAQLRTALRALRDALDDAEGTLTDPGL